MSDKLNEVYGGGMGFTSRVLLLFFHAFQLSSLQRVFAQMFGRAPLSTATRNPPFVSGSHAKYMLRKILRQSEKYICLVNSDLPAAGHRKKYKKN